MFIICESSTCAVSFVKVWTGYLNAGTDLESTYMITAEAHNITLWR